MPVIYCHLHMGNLKHLLFLIDDKASTELGGFTVEELPGAIATIANQEGIKKVQLETSLTYGNILTEEIISYSNKNFNNRELEVEIIPPASKIEWKGNK